MRTSSVGGNACFRRFAPVLQLLGGGFEADRLVGNSHSLSYKDTLPDILVPVATVVPACTFGMSGRALSPSGLICSAFRFLR